MKARRAIGADRCPGGWCVVTIREEAGERLVVESPRVVATFAEVAGAAADAVGVDVPIGLRDGLEAVRTCDRIARRCLRPRAARVFNPPLRSVLRLETYEEAKRATERWTGRSLPYPWFALHGKIREVDEAARREGQERMREVHTELAFWAMNGGAPVLSRKRTLAGLDERRALLEQALDGVPEACFAPGPLRAADDAADALVCAWTALCALRGTARAVPGSPATDACGLRMEMWVPPANDGRELDPERDPSR